MTSLSFGALAPVQTRPLTRVSQREGLLATAAVLGGSLVVAGALSPWITVFAGLHPYPGTLGLNGRLLLGGGVLSVLAGLAFLLYPAPQLRWAISGLGLVLLAFGGYLLPRLWSAQLEIMSAHSMMVPELGPGLFICLAGALMVAATTLFGRGVGTVHTR